LQLHLGRVNFPRQDQISEEGSSVDGDNEPKIDAHDELQTFVFSATLSKELQVNLKKKRSSKGSTKHYKREEKSSTLGVSGFHLHIN
jgi:ATP-dependent RNA helicase DDX24/MAK5